MKKQVIKLISYLLFSVVLITLESLLIAMMGTIINSNFTYWTGVLTAVVLISLVVFNFTVVKHTYKSICNAIVYIKVLKDSKKSCYAKVYNPYNHLETVLNDKGLFLLEKYLNLDTVHRISNYNFKVKHDITSDVSTDRRSGVPYVGVKSIDNIIIDLEFYYKLDKYEMSCKIKNYKAEVFHILTQKNGKMGNTSKLFTLNFYVRLLQVVSDVLGSSITFISYKKTKKIRVNNSIKIYNNYVREYLRG